MTIPKEFIAQVDQRFERLRRIYAETGTPRDQQRENFQSLCDSMLVVVDCQVEEALAQKETVQSAITNILDRIGSLKRLMGEYVADNNTGFDSRKPLLQLKDQLETELQTVQQQYQQKLASVKELQDQLLGFVDSLQGFVNTDLIVEEDVDVSLPTVTALEEEIERCSNEYRTRVRRAIENAKQIAALWFTLGMGPESHHERLISQISTLAVSDSPTINPELLTDDGMRQTEMRKSELEELRQERQFRKQEILQHLHRLWDRLKIPSEDRAVFIDNNSGLTQRDIQQFEDELKNLISLKEERLEEFIQDARNDLHRLWDRLYFSQEERKAFAPAFSDEFTDSCLELHENEIARLELLVEDWRYVLEKVERHMKLLEEIREFEESTNDPSRLFGKGRRDPGRLLREEKFRKRISRELPKIKKDLEGALKEFEQTTGKPFCVNGEPYINRLQDDHPKKQQKASSSSAAASTSGNTTTTKRYSRYDIDNDDIYYSKAMTSPRFKSTSISYEFRTPQPARSANNFTRRAIRERRQQLRQNENDSEPSILHRVREHNIRKRNAATKSVHNRVQHKPRTSDATTSSSSRDSIFSRQDENRPPSDSEEAPSDTGEKTKKRLVVRAGSPMLVSDDDDEVALHSNLFDDGPELSELSADEGS